MPSGRLFRLLVACLLLATLQSTLRGQSAASVELITVTPSGIAGGGETFLDDVNLYGTGLTNISADNRLVVFSSASPDLVAGDVNGFQDVFVRDRLTGVTSLVSVDSAGVQGNRQSGQPVISADGRYVAFVSVATNLVPGDNNRTFDTFGNLVTDGMDIFVRDLQTQTTVRASVSTAGAEAEFSNIAPAISADGRYVAFNSSSRNLASGDADNFNVDVFVRDLVTNTTQLVSLRPDGGEIVGADAYQPSISADGRRVAFTVFDNTLNGPTPTVPPTLTRGVYVRDLNLGQTILVSARPDGTPATFIIADFPMISANGRYVSFANWEDLDPAHPDSAEEELLDGPFADIFVRDLQTSTTRRASLPYPGGATEESARISSISADGRFVAYTNRTDMVVRDMIANRTSVIRAPDGSSPTSYNLTLSQDARFAFTESFTDLIVPNDTNGVVDAFLFVVPPSAGADLSLTLSASATQPAPDSDVTFTIAATNDGGENASGISVAIPLPAGLTYVSDTGSGALVGGTWTIASLAAGSTATLELVAHVDTLSPVTVNAEIMTAAPLDPDSTPGNGNLLEDDQRRLVITPQAIDLALTLTANTSTPPVNANVTLTIALSNSGSVTATGVAARLVLPTGLTFISSSGVGAYDPATGVWTPGGIAAGGSPLHRVVARVITAAPIDLVAEVTAANELDRDSTPNNGVVGEDDQAAVRLAPVNTGIVVNDTTGVVDGNDGKCTLVEAIIAANTDAPSGNAVGECAGGNGADVIHLRALAPPYVFGTVHNTVLGPNALPAITSDITIDGGGAVIHRSFAAGTPAFRLFVIAAAGRLVLDRVQVRSGSSTSLLSYEAQFGGAIYNAGRLEINGGAVSNSTASCDGGGIYSVGPLLVRGNATIHNNATSCSGGGIAALFATSVSVVDSAIEYNFAGEGGGGLFIHGTTTATVTGSRIIGNFAIAEGGGVFTHNADANLTIVRTEIRDNSAATNGGGISNGRLDPEGISFVAGGVMSITDSTVARNTASRYGGGIANAGPLTVTNSTIDSNRVFGPAGICGGGIYSAAPLTMVAPVMGGNQSFFGGAICANGQSLDITGGRINGNSAIQAGGGMMIGYARSPVRAAGPRSIRLTGVTIENNTAGFGGGTYSALQRVDVLTATNMVVQRNTATAAGGGLALTGGSYTIGNIQLRDNVSSLSGGGIVFDDLTFAEPTTLVVQGGIVDGNVTTGGAGGGIANVARHGGSLLTLNDVTMTNNRAPSLAGGAVFNGGQTIVTNGLFSANSASRGGALANGTSTLAGGPITLTNTRFESNVAANQGGAIFTDNPPGGPASVVTTVIGGTIGNNRAVDGGGIFIRPNTTVNLRSSSLVFDNAASGLGGGVFNDGTLDVTETTIFGNRADQGGGINAGGETTIIRSTLAANRARIGGAGQNRGFVTISSSTISGNVASGGTGGLDVVGSVAPGGGLNGITLITRSTIVGNVGSPGGIANVGSLVQTVQTILAGNRRPDNAVSECTSTPGANYNPFDTIVGVDPGCALYQVAIIAPQNAAFGLRTIDASTVFTSLVGPLADNGGPTFTHKLLPGSLAIDAVIDRGASAPCSIDQRGLPRPIDGDGDGHAACDVGAVEQQDVTSSPAVVLTSLVPPTAVIGAAPARVSINGTGFTAGSVALWNGSPRPTFAASPTRLIVDLLPGDVSAAEDIATALVTVTNPLVAASNALPFTIISSRVSSVHSLAANPGTAASVTAIGINATLTNNGGGTAVVTVASYSSNPTGGTIFAAGGFFDLQVTGADAADSVTANFYYPFTVTGATEAALQLRYWNGSAWAPVIASGGAVPSKNTTDNVDGVLLSGGKFSVTLDATSTPGITALAGTVFALADGQARQPKIFGIGYTLSDQPAERATYSLNVNGLSALPGGVKYSYARLGINAYSSSVTSYVVNGSTATIEGRMAVNGSATYKYVVTATVGSPSTFAIVITRADDSVYYSTPAMPVLAGSLVFMP